MKKLLLIVKKVMAKSRKSFSAVALLLMFFGITQSTHAQVYYLQTSGKGNVSDVANAIKKVDYTGGNDGNVTTSFPNPALFEPDLPNNRAFIYNGFLGNRVINVVNMSTGGVINTITLPAGIQVSGPSVTAIKYDPINDWVYYVTNGNGTSATLNAIYRSKPDGTQNTALATGVGTLPQWLALDIPNNRVFIYEGVFSDRKIMTFDLSSNTVTGNAAVSNIANAIAYDPITDYLYYITSDNDQINAGTTNDALRKIRPGGSGGEITIKSSLVKSPQYMALDAGNNRAFVYNGYYGSSTTIRLDDTGIYAVDLTTGATTRILDHSGLQNTPNYLRVMGIFAPARPILSTTAVSTYSSTTATLGGNATRSDASVTARGVVYSSSNATPTIGGSGVTQATNGTGTGSFSASISGLSASTTYYVSAYATSGAGTTYGPVVSFSTLSNDATLSGLSLSSGSLNTTFTSATTSYTASVVNATTSVTITPIRNQGNATIKVNGTTVTSGLASGNISLNTGDNIITTIVTAQDGSTTKTYTVTVNRSKAAQTITFASTATKAYGNADYAPGATSSAGLTVSYSSDNTAVATIAGGNIHIVGPGTANVTASQAGDASNLAATSVVQVLTVSNAAITVTATAANKIYGDADPTLTYSITSGALVGTDAFTGALTRDVGTNIGTYNITQGTLALSNKYTLTFVSGVFTVNKRAISIQPAPASKVYGDADPGSYPYYYRVGSLASTDGMTGSFVRVAGETPGTYALSIGNKHPVNATTGVDQTSNYDITFIPEYLTITKRVITLQPIPATKVYGDADPGFPYRFTVGSLAPGEGMTGTFGRPVGEDVGVYALTLGTKRPVNSTTGVFTDQYYTISIISDNLTITKKTIRVSANTQNKTYGDADPALTYAADALGFSDTFSGTLTRATGEGVGTYAISQGTLALNTNNYNLSFTGSNLTINKKTINVTANAQSKTYGDADPALTYTADALKSGDSFTGALTRVAGEGAGSYAINQGSLALNSNYTLAFTGNNLSIGQKIINITANAQTKTYGDADPALTYTADALLGGDTFTGALTRTGGETAGNYAINQGSLAASTNYALNYTGNNLAIGKVTLTYVATPTTKISQAPNPTFTGTVTGFVNGDTQASATTGTLSFTSTATDSSPQGTYPINGSGLSAANYSFIQLPANSSALTVVLSPDATLSNITVSQGTLNTPFDAGTLQYTVNVDHNTTSFFLTAVLHQSNATMLVNGVALTSGLATTMPLSAGVNYFNIVVTAQDGTSTQTYLVTVSRAFSTNTLLTNIALSGITLNPVFDSNTTTYTASVGNLVDGTDATATTADVDASAQLGPVKLSATTPYHLTLHVGDNPINVDGVAQNGDIKHYYITVTRAASSDASLASLNTTVLTFNEPFSSTTYNYTATVANNVAQFNFAPVATNNAAIITYNGDPVTYYGVTPTLNYGVNTYNIIVKSEDGTATNTYTITVTRTLSSDNNLATLSIPYVTSINEPFDSSVLNYTATLSDSTITGLPLTAYSYDPNATMKINGTAVTRFANYDMTLHGGDNTFNIVVTPQDNSTPKTYKLVLTRAGMPPPLFSPNATLAAMSVSATGYSHNFNFAFDALTPLTVANKVTAVRIHPVIAADGATVTVNGVALAYDASTDLLPLNVGDNIFSVVVTAADGVHTTTTTLHMNRLPFADVSLASLALNAGTLSPAFLGTTFTYSASVPYSVSTLDITPVANAAGAVVSLGATTISAGTPSVSVPLNTGLPNRIRITVTAADGVNTQVYTLNVTRLAPEIALASLTLSDGTLSPSFSGATTSYTASVTNSVSSVTVKPLAVDPGSAVTVNGISPDYSGIVNIPLSVGENIITTIVTGQDGTTTKTYTVTVTRAIPSTDAKLTAIAINRGVLSPVFESTNYAYTISDITAESVTLTPTKSDTTSTVTINGKAADDNKPFAVPLHAGSNTINVEVTAQDYATTNMYVVTVNRLIPAAPTLSYTGPNIYAPRVVINPLTPTTTGADAPGYGALKEKIVVPANTPTGVAKDAAGNIYVADIGTGGVFKIPAAGGAAEVIGSGFNTPFGVATDAAGNVYVADLGDTIITRIHPGIGHPRDTLAKGVLFPTAIAVDAAGNIYVSDGLAHRGIYKYPVGGGAKIALDTTSFTNPYGIALDAAGNVYVADANDTAIKRIPVGGGTTVTIGTVTYGSTGIAVDSLSNVYAIDAGNNAVKKFPANGGAPTTLVSGFVGPFGLVLDKKDNLYVSDNGNGELDKITPVGGFHITPSLPVGLVLNDTTGVITGNPGVLSPAKNYTVTTYNSGGSVSATVNIAVKEIPELSSLTLSKGTLSPVFDKNVLAYHAEVDSAAAFINITPTVRDTTSRIRINGTLVASGAAQKVLLVKGNNTINVVVTALDNSTKTYVLTVNRSILSNSAGIVLTVTPASTLSITTGPSTVNYFTSVSPDVAMVTITPKAANPGAVITIEGVPIASGSASAPITLNSGVTTIHLQSIAEDGITIRTYSVVVNRNGSSNVGLNLAVSPASTLTRSTGSANFNYTTSVVAGTGSITITPTPSAPGAVVTVEGNVVASGMASAPISLPTALTTVHMQITAPDGVTTRTYEIAVSRNGSSNVGLNFTMDPANTLTRTTGTADINYVVSVASGISSVTVTPKANDPNAIVTVEGVTVASGVASAPVTLHTGATTIHMQITAPDGITIRTYTIVVNRNGSSNAGMSVSLTPASTLTPVAGTADFNYVTSVSAATNSVSVTPKASDPDAVITVEGTTVASGAASDPITLTGAATTIHLQITAPDGTTTRSYAIVVNRNGSSNVGLNLSMTPSSTLTRVTTGEANFNYVTSVTAGTNSVTITPVPSAVGAVVTVEGVVVNSGTPSAPIAITGSSKTIHLQITAPDGITTRSYAIVVSRSGSSNVGLALKTTPSTPLTIATGSSDVNYAATVAASVNSLTVTPNATELNAVIKVEGVIVASGAASAPITLGSGVTTIHAQITAQDGITVKTFEIQVSKAASSLSFVSKANDVPAGDDASKPVTEAVVVHQGVSPNGDGINDYLTIDGLTNTDNHLSVMNGSGILVFETKGYGSNGNVFDGHSNKSSSLLNAGTYFYSLDYKEGDVTKHKTGYIILKY